MLKFSRVLLGLVFILSGLIKQNDPLGFSYKLQEYFEVFNISFLDPYAIYLSIGFCALEITLGILMLFKINIKKTLLCSLVLLVFFAFLTFYSAYYEKVKSCGCFGEVIVLTPWSSFAKDIILIILTVIVLLNENKSKNDRDKQINSLPIGIFVVSTLFGVYTYKNLPLLDFSDYKVGTNLQALEEQNKLEGLAFDQEWNDYTKKIVNSRRTVILITLLNSGNVNKKAINTINATIKFYKNKPDLDIYIISPISGAEYSHLKKYISKDVEILFIDAILLKTLIRTDVGLIVIKEGIINSKCTL